ncbi:MAG: hypothetical protein HN742_29235 [Lentisphaerae bacterium]|nr:hypothetical protein [Lentisphaerota bacterium]MBT4818556.1 hypothetical protein [Lentisphaerota bacterium]MBT5611022.1 hypothetical protein [Lentisphaerota bacterium]MBT7059345.1 hypothetical protein [Lentisphaerota bacterium]MBT7845992.1 hypothetical protein [Lentisphaerota bacterium]
MYRKRRGFGYVRKPGAGAFRTLSSVVHTSLFPEQDAYRLGLRVTADAP